jgi:ATP/maltotriose-dependent transcriptional regulator MalT
MERALEHARRARDQQQETDILMSLSLALYYGPTPVEDGIARLKEILTPAAEPAGRSEAVLLSLSTRAGVEVFLSGLEAMRGSFHEARLLYTRAKDGFAKLGHTFKLGVAGEISGSVEMLAGDAAAAERELRCSHETLTGMGEKIFSHRCACLLADCLYRQGRYSEAEDLTKSAQREALDSVGSQVYWRAKRAKVIAHGGELKQGESLAREAVTIADQTDNPHLRGDARMDLGEVLHLAGQSDEAAIVISEAVAVYEAKGNIVAMGRAKAIEAAVSGTTDG